MQYSRNAERNRLRECTATPYSLQTAVGGWVFHVSGPAASLNGMANFLELCVWASPSPYNIDDKFQIHHVGTRRGYPNEIFDRRTKR